MIEKSINIIVEKAKELNNENKKWHFHMLGKACKFNENKGKFCIIFENEETCEFFFCIFDEKPLKEAKMLADLMYGQEFLDKQEKDEHNPDFDLILQKTEELTEHGKAWHHHHLHPNCIFNEHKGKHCIVLEDETRSETLIAVYNQKPMEDLVKIERLFYKDLRN